MTTTSTIHAANLARVSDTGLAADEAITALDAAIDASVVGAAAPVADCYVEARTRAGALVRRHGPFVRDSADERMAYHAEECAALGWNRGRPHDDPRGLRVRCVFEAPAPAMVPQPAQLQQACAVRFTVRNDNPATIWNRLAARLGREPTAAEAKAAVQRILRGEAL